MRLKEGQRLSPEDLWYLAVREEDEPEVGSEKEQPEKPGEKMGSVAPQKPK